MSKSNLLEKIQISAFISEYLDWLQERLNQRPPLTKEELERFFSPEFHLNSNGNHIVKNLTDFLYRLELIKKKYAQFEISDLEVEPLVDEAKKVISYNLHLTDRNSKSVQVHIMAIVTIDNNKFIDWVEVTNEAGSNTWDKK